MCFFNVKSQEFKFDFKGLKYIYSFKFMPKMQKKIFEKQLSLNF